MYRSHTRRFYVLVGALLLAPAGRAATDTEALKRRVYTEYPQLREGKLDYFERVTLIRQWAWSHIPFPSSAANCLDADPKSGWSRLDAATMFQRFDEDRGGVMCGGAALALQRLYEAFGYTAWTVDMGFSDPKEAATHVTTLVKVRTRGSAVICIQDATFNITFVEAASGQPLDYFELLRRLARADHRSFRLLESDHRKVPTRPSLIYAARDVGGQSPQDIAASTWFVRPDDYTVKKLPDGSLKFTSWRTVRQFLKQCCRTRDGQPAWYLARLVDRGHPPELAYLYLYPLGMGGPDSETMLRKAKALTAPAPAAPVTPQMPTYKRLKAYLDAVPAIDTHDHLWPFEKLPGYVETEHGRGMNLAGLWHNSYYRWTHPLTPWKPGGKFDDWWAKAKHDFADARATSFYRYQLPAFQDLYGVDFDRITDAQARELNERIYRNYLNTNWLYEVITQRANIELMFNDPYWARLDFRTDYPFGVLVFNVTTLTRGFHPSEFNSPWDDPYRFAKEKKRPVESLDDYLDVLDRLFREAKDKGAACLKTTLAYQRTLRFDKVAKERAARVFGRPRTGLSAAEIKEFEDYIMWQLVRLSAKYELPFQIHTGDARLQGSNPMRLVDLIEANPKTKFILFHGGYPWVGETAAIVLRHGSHVWVDSVWLPTISYHMAKRAFHEWLDVMPSSRILWGADCNHAEGIYGATEFTRRCLAEVLAERVDRDELREEHAQRIGKQILRDNALALFPQLKTRLWKGTGKLRTK